MSDDFRYFVCNIEPSPEDLRDYIYDKHATVPLASETAVKKECDYRGDMLPVVEQGPVGSCAAQTGASIKEWQEYVETGVNSKKSAHFLYDNRSENAPGMYPRDLMKIIAKKGIPEEKEWPYRSSKQLGEKILKIPERVSKLAYKNRTKKYYRVTTIKSIEDALDKHGPLLIAVPVYHLGMKMWKPQYSNQPMSGGHAMTVVGYIKDGIEDRLIIRNSWGSSWGDNGYTYMPYDEVFRAWEFWACIDHIEEPLTDTVRYRARKVWSNISKFKLGYGALAASLAALAFGVAYSLY